MRVRDACMPGLCVRTKVLCASQEYVYPWAMCVYQDCVCVPGMCVGCACVPGLGYKCLPRLELQVQAKVVCESQGCGYMPGL